MSSDASVPRSPGSERSSSNKPQPRRSGYRWLFYGVIPLIIVGAVSFTLFQTARNTPSRERAVQLGPVGQVLVNLRTNPYPALTTGTVVVEIMLRDMRGNGVRVDRIRVTYGMEGEPVRQAEMVPAQMAGMYQTGVQFPSVGEWWMEVTLEAGPYTATTRFTIPVRAAL